jgi:hypothetical protein
VAVPWLATASNSGAESSALEADQARLAGRASKVNRSAASRSDSAPSFCVIITTATINGGTDRRRRSVNRFEKNLSGNR